MCHQLIDEVASHLTAHWHKLRAMDAASIAAVGSGAVGGAVARYAVATYGKRRGALHPWPTTLVNLAGSFVLGAVVASTALPPRAKLLVGTGFCGSFTTFSTYSVETVFADEIEQLPPRGRNGLQHAAPRGEDSALLTLQVLVLRGRRCHSAHTLQWLVEARL